MADAQTDAEKIAALEARVEALSVAFKTILSAFVIRGLLTKASVEQILRDAEEAVHHPHSAQELNAVRNDLPHYLRHAMGPVPDDDDHGH
jgi:hypothetical protein